MKFLVNMFFSISKSIDFPYVTQLKYCPKLDFEADPQKQMKNPKKKILLDFQIN